MTERKERIIQFLNQIQEQDHKEILEDYKNDAISLEDALDQLHNVNRTIWDILENLKD